VSHDGVDNDKSFRFVVTLVDIQVELAWKIGRVRMIALVRWNRF
jgi:hypothetical protein